MERFFNYFQPYYYNLELKLNRVQETLSGSVKVSGVVRSEMVKFHAVGLEITSVEYSLDEISSQVLPCRFTTDGEILSIPITHEIAPYFYKTRNLQSIEFDELFPDPAQSTTFIIKFQTKLKHNMQGCYLSTYEYNGAEQRIVATQFESHYAREAFPCIDEPEAKATFRLELEVADLAPGDVVLANSPLETHFGNKFFFQTTPKMSTYLLAWVIGPLKSVSTVNRHGIRVSSYCALNQPEENLIFANRTAADALDYYDDHFATKYPLAKLDQVALPDFEAGAMENWGLVTYRESMMLVEPHGSVDVKRSVALTVTHELSHQWFGDLVTMKWWDELWLNESFATIMEYLATDRLYPDLDAWEDFFTYDCIIAFQRDALPGVQAVQQPVHDPAEIATLFDSAIVYAKGARLILMLIRLMGEENFYQGLRYYFNKFSYKNTVGDDLWHSLQPYAEFDIKKFMHAWITQPGFPSLQITHNGDQTHYRQQRFLINGATDELRWPIPEVKDDMSGHYVLELSDTEFQDKLQHFSNLSLEQKLRLLIDCKLLARANLVSSVLLLDLLPKFTDETSASVLSIVSDLIADLKVFCESDETRADFRAYLSQTFSERINSINLKTDELDVNEIRARDFWLDLAHYTHDIETLTKLTHRYRDDLSQIDPELRTHALAAKLYLDESGSFPVLYERYRYETNPDLRAAIRCALATNVKIPANINKMLNLLERPEIVRPQDHVFLFADLLANRHTRIDALDWLYEHWNYVEEMAGDKSLEDYARLAARAVRTPQSAEKFNNFFAPLREQPILKRVLELSRVEISTRLNLLKSQTEVIRSGLQELLK